MYWWKFIIIFVILIKRSYSEWNEIATICPNQCVCQQSHLNDLSIARWTSNFDNIILGDNENLYTTNVENNYQENNENGNEAFYENDSTHVNNPLVKFIMCFLQLDTNVKVLLSLIPQDVEALTLLYTGTQNNYTVQTSDIVNLPDLQILEIRGNTERDLHLVIDMALPQLKFANFESITIYSSDSLKRRRDKIDPSQYFDYTPESEKNTEYNVTTVTLEISQKDQIEIVPYEIYLQQLRKSREISFYGWTDLNVLRIHECKLDELQWEIFDGLENVKHLSLEHNGIKIIPPFSFFGVPKLKTLSVAHNEILDLNYRALAGLLELISLDLSYNNLTKLSELTFPPFPKLKIIDLRDNPVRAIYPFTFAVMNDTRKLSIGSELVSLKISGKETFKPLKNLKYLSIKNCNIPSLKQETFHNLKSLEVLQIDRGTIKTIEFDAFTENLNLKQLFITNCGLEELSMDAFYGLNQIEIIDLSHNNISNLRPGIFDDKPRLKEIYLQYNQLESLPTNFFNVTLLNVKLIRLTHNPWFCTCEMMNWNQETTNMVRTGFEVKQCHGQQNLKIMENCNRKEYKYMYNNKMTPRCDGGPDNAKQRSIYYTIRRTLNCKPIAAPSKPNKSAAMQPNHDTKLSILKAKQARADDQRLQLLTHRRSNDPNLRKVYNSEKAHHYQHKFVSKYEKTIAQENNLHYQMDLIDKRKPVLDRKPNSYDYDKNSIL